MPDRWWLVEVMTEQEIIKYGTLIATDEVVNLMLQRQFSVQELVITDGQIIPYKDKKESNEITRL